MLHDADITPHTLPTLTTTLSQVRLYHRQCPTPSPTCKLGARHAAGQSRQQVQVNVRPHWLVPQVHCQALKSASVVRTPHLNRAVKTVTEKRGQIKREHKLLLGRWSDSPNRHSMQGSFSTVFRHDVISRTYPDNNTHRPGRVSAGSSTSLRLVAPITTIPEAAVNSGWVEVVSAVVGWGMGVVRG